MDWGFFGCGLAIVILFVQSKWKIMPNWMIWPGISSGILFMIWGFIQMVFGQQKLLVGPALLFIVCFAGLVGSIVWGKNMITKANEAEQRPAETVPPQKDFFKVNIPVTMNFNWPGPLLYVYDSAIGKTISPVNIALWVEAVNNKPGIMRIQSYNCKVLLKYDEGGKQNIIISESGEKTFRYIPSGRVVEKWRVLHPMGFPGNKIYWVTNNDWSKCKQIDLNADSFDKLALETQLEHGQSIMGWMFFELDGDLLGQVPEIKAIELTLKDTLGDSQTFLTEQKSIGEDGFNNVIAAGRLHFLGGYLDLSKNKYTLTPMFKVKKDVK